MSITAKQAFFIYRTGATLWVLPATGWINAVYIYKAVTYSLQGKKLIT